MSESFLGGPVTSGETVEVKSQVRVSREQAEAFKALPEDVQSKLGPPVFGQVMSAKELSSQGLARTSTVMCPW